MLWKEQASTLCTPKFWLWLTEDKEVQISLELQKMGHPLTHLSSCWKTFLEQTRARLPRWVELSQDCVNVSPASWARLAGVFMPSTSAYEGNPMLYHRVLSVESSCSTFCNYSLLHFCVLECHEPTGLVGKGSQSTAGSPAGHSPGPLEQPGAVCAEAAASQLWIGTQGCTGYAGNPPGQSCSL